MKCQINLRQIGSNPKCESKCSRSCRNVILQLIQSSAFDLTWPMKNLFATPLLLHKLDNWHLSIIITTAETKHCIKETGPKINPTKCPI